MTQKEQELMTVITLLRESMRNQYCKNILESGQLAEAIVQAIFELRIESKYFTTYRKDEQALQYEKMRSFGIDIDGQTFEQCVNTLIWMVEESRKPIEVFIQDIYEYLDETTRIESEACQTMAKEIAKLIPSEKWPPEPKGTTVAAISTANCFEHIPKRDTGADDVLKANGELLDVLKNIEHLCESNSPAHDEIWAIAYDAIRKFK